jgi:hypothetical protein
VFALRASAPSDMPRGGSFTVRKTSNASTIPGVPIAMKVLRQPRF